MGAGANYGEAIDETSATGALPSDDDAAERLRRALLVVALDRTAEVRVVGAALIAGGADASVLVVAESDGALRLDGGRVSFVSASAERCVIEAATPTERRAAHRVLAAATTDARHRLQRAEHLAAAAVGPDADAAEAFAELAAAATLQGDNTLASERFERAASFAPDPHDSAMHRYHAGDALWNAGRYDEARDAYVAAHRDASDPLLRADIAVQLGQLDMYQRGPRHSRDLFVAAADAVAPHDVDRAVVLLVHAASTVILSSDVVGTLALARRATALAEGGDGISALPASLMLAFISLQHGDVAEFDERFPSLLAIADQLLDSDPPDVDLFLQLVGMVHVYTEQWGVGRLYLEAVAHRAERRARSATAALATATLAELSWRSGRWQEAWTLTTSALVTGVTLTGARLWLLAFTAHLDAGCGRADDCRRRAHAAIVDSEPMGFGTAVIWAHHALGLLELGLGHPVAAAAHLDRVDVVAAAHQIVEPSVVWWQADHVEALVRSGRTREATRALIRFEANAERSPRAWASAVTRRCRGLLATSIGEAERWFAASLAWHERLPSPFELGRTLLCRAERRLALGSGLDPLPDLLEAAAIFAALGAEPWSAQAHALRDTVTARDERAVDDALGHDLLSPAERRVVDAVVAGMTNREVSANLYVSEKTVEFHLHNVYRKLGVRSRTQLVRRETRR